MRYMSMFILLYTKDIDCNEILQFIMNVKKLCEFNERMRYKRVPFFPEFKTP